MWVTRKSLQQATLVGDMIICISQNTSGDCFYLVQILYRTNHTFWLMETVFCTSVFSLFHFRYGFLW